MNKYEAKVIGAFTGILIGEFSDLHQYIEEKMERPVFTHEMGSKDFMTELKEKVREDFLEICGNIYE